MTSLDRRLRALESAGGIVEVMERDWSDVTVSQKECFLTVFERHPGDGRIPSGGFSEALYHGQSPAERAAWNEAYDAMFGAPMVPVRR